MGVRAGSSDSGRASDPVRLSVVVASYRGERTIDACLTSLARQTLSRGNYEIVVVHNGPGDSTDSHVAAVREAYPDLNLRLLRYSQSGAGLARNVGIHAARGGYVTFVDDDDCVSPSYLESLLTVSSPTRVGLAPMADVRSRGSAPNFDIPGLIEQLSLTDEIVSAERMPGALSFSAAKSIPTVLAKAVGFDAGLRSGEDIVFFMRLYAALPFELAPVPLESNAVYYRTIRNGSISRQPASYDFNVTQRLDVIERLEQLESRANHIQALNEYMITGQARFINRFLREVPEQHAQVLADIERRGLQSVPFAEVNRGIARDVAILYAAPPYSDTSGIVAARRVRDRKLPVDVISASLAESNEQDEGLREIWQPYVDQHYETPTRPVWIWGPGLAEFCTLALNRLETWTAAKGVYRTAYSRAMWIASHIAAALYKVRHPEVHWVAEFSDPLLRDIENNDRSSAGAFDQALLAELSVAFQERGLRAPGFENIFEWVELVTYAFADEIIFTNSNQREYMLGYCSRRDLADRARSRSAIEPHPTLPEHFYRLRDADYEMDPGRVHVGYFGRFYVSRGLTEVVEALHRTQPSTRRRLLLHVFTPDPDALMKEVQSAGLDGVIVARPYAGYLEFLNLCRRFDVLLVNDARTSDSHSGNPYLPSKYADYLGSGTPIWSIYEVGSPLAQESTSFRSELGDVEGARKILEELVRAERAE